MHITLSWLAFRRSSPLLLVLERYPARAKEALSGYRPKPRRISDCH